MSYLSESFVASAGTRPGHWGFPSKLALADADYPKRGLLLIHFSALFLLINIGIWIGIDTAANASRTCFHVCTTGAVQATHATQVHVGPIQDGHYRVEVAMMGPWRSKTQIFEECTPEQVSTLVSAAVAFDPNTLLVIDASKRTAWEDICAALELLQAERPKVIQLETNDEERVTTSPRRLVPRRELPILAYVFSNVQTQ